MPWTTAACMRSNAAACMHARSSLIRRTQTYSTAYAHIIAFYAQHFACTAAYDKRIHPADVSSTANLVALCCCCSPGITTPSSMQQ
jgi:hypothetical protein